MSLRGAVRNALPLLFAVAAGGGLWRWLWGRWFSPGGEYLHGCIHLALLAGCLIHLVAKRRRAGTTDPISLSIATLFLLAAAVLYARIPTLFVAALYAGAIYWSYRSSPECAPGGRSFALWPLLVLSLPIGPSLQFVFGYPLRALAARTAALILPGDVRAVGCGLGDGMVEVFVDAPCAGAGMLVAALFLAAGISLAFGFGWPRCGVMLVAGLLCALIANAMRAAMLYLGTAGLIAVPLHRYETATGLFCFTASAAVLVAAAWTLNRPTRRGAADAAAVRAMERGNARTVAGAAFFLACIGFCAVVFSTPGRRPQSALPEESVIWPETWDGQILAASAPTAETRQFWSNFPGACREFSVIDGDGTREPGHTVGKRIVMRLVGRPTRLLHPAEDCFRGAGYSVAPLPARKDEGGRLWSRFIAGKNAGRYVVRQCVVAVRGFDLRGADLAAGARSWPDISSWYWDVAKPGSDTPAAALALTVIELARPHIPPAGIGGNVIQRRLPARETAGKSKGFPIAVPRLAFLKARFERTISRIARFFWKAKKIKKDLTFGR